MKCLRSSERGKTSRTRGGLVLIIVLIVVVMVSLAGFGFVATMFAENQAVRLRGEQLEIEQAMASAELLIGLESRRDLLTGTGSMIGLNADDGTLVEGAGLFDNPTMFQARPLIPDSEDPGSIRFTVLSPRDNRSGSASSTLSDEMPVRYGIEDESSRLNLSVLPDWERLVPGSGRDALMKLSGMTEDIAAAILDWLDADGIPRDLGAEGEYYSTLNPPYSPRNGTPESIEELLLVRGVTRKLLYGVDANRNGVIENSEVKSSSDIASADFGDATTGWERYLTLYSREVNNNSVGHPRIYTNDHDLSRLYLRLSAVNKSWGEYIILYRQFGPVQNSTNLPQGITTVSNSSPDLGIPAKFSVRSIVELIDSSILVPAVGSKPSVLFTSPFSSDPEHLGGVLTKMFDELTVDPQHVIEGRINLNSASSLVLGMIPGLPVESIDRIVAAQDRVSGKVSEERKTPAWLWGENILSRESFEKILPFVTCRSTAFRAQIVGYSSQSKLASRAEVVIDVSTPSPQRLYWKDRQILGRGYHWSLIDPDLAGVTLSGTFAE